MGIRAFTIEQVEKFTKNCLKGLNLSYETKIEKEDEWNAVRIGSNKDWGFDPVVSIDESEVEMPSIRGTETYKGYQVVGYVHSMGSRWEPPSTDVVELGEFISMFDAVHKAVFRLAENEFNLASEQFAHEVFPEYEEVS